MKKLLSFSRYIIILPVIASFIASIFLIVFASVKETTVIWDTLRQGEASTKEIKYLAVSLVEIVELFLLSTGFYLIALGFYELFISDDLDLPAWLSFHNFDDLKGALVSIIIVILGASFLSETVKWGGQIELLWYGLAVGAVITALTYFTAVKVKKGNKSVE